MNDPLGVRGFEGTRDLQREGHGLFDRNRTAPDAVLEGLSLHQLEDEELLSVVLIEPVDGRDVLMIERGQDLRLALESRHAFGVTSKGLGEDLERHLPPELGVLGAVDLAHTAFAELARDFEMRKAFPDHSAFPHDFPAVERPCPRSGRACPVALFDVLMVFFCSLFSNI
jgi:hypothetical protein